MKSSSHVGPHDPFSSGVPEQSESGQSCPLALWAMSPEELMMMSHQLREALTTLKGWAELSSETTQNSLMGVDNEAVHQALGAIEGLVNDLQDAVVMSSRSHDKSQLTAGESTSEWVNIDVLIRGLVHQVCQTIPVSEVSCGVVLDMSPGLPSQFQMDSLGVFRILELLLTDVFKAHIEGTVWIKVACPELSEETTLLPKSEKHQQLSIQVTFPRFVGDEVWYHVVGPHDQSMSKYIAHPNHEAQVHRSNEFEDKTRRVHQYRVSRACKLLRLGQGNVALSHQTNRVQVLSITMPVKTSNTASAPLLGLPALLEDETLIVQKRFQSDLLEDALSNQPKILVVEDNVLNQRVIAHPLEASGYKVYQARDGHQAIGLSALINFDLIIMDCQLPQMDGYETVAYIRNREQEKQLTPVPILALTGHTMDDEYQRCMSVGMNAFLSKPFDRQTLLSLVDQLLDIRWV